MSTGGTSASARVKRFDLPTPCFPSIISIDPHQFPLHSRTLIECSHTFCPTNVDIYAFKERGEKLVHPASRLRTWFHVLTPSISIFLYTTRSYILLIPVIYSRHPRYLKKGKPRRVTSVEIRDRVRSEFSRFRSSSFCSRGQERW